MDETKVPDGSVSQDTEAQEPSSPPPPLVDEGPAGPDDVPLMVEEEVIELDAGVPPLPPTEPVPEERHFYQREATALAEQRPERAALMLFEAAASCEIAGAEEQGLTDLEAALKLRPDSPWLLPLARRMLMRLRRFDRALEVCRDEVRLGGENAIRAAVLLEAAALARFFQGNAKKALDLVEAALKVQPGDVNALLAAIALRGELGQHAAVGEALSQLSVALTVAEERSLYLYAAGTVRETLLDQTEAAESDYRRAVEADRQNLPAVMALSALYERQGNWPQLCATLEHMAQLIGPPGEARLLLVAGSLHLDRTGDLEAAARDLQRAASSAPDRPAVLQRLAHVYEAKGQVEGQIETMRRLLDRTPDRQGRAALLTHIGTLLQQARPGEPDNAIDAYREALDEVEGYLPALQSLSTLYRQQGDYDSLLAIYEPEIEGPLQPAARAVRCVEMGAILTDRLSRPEDAVVWYRRALELDPDLHIAFWGLRRLLRQLGRYEQLAELLVESAANSKDERTRNALLCEAGGLQADLLGDSARAIETLEPVREATANRCTAIQLLDLYEQTGRTVELVGFLLAQAQATEDPQETQGRRLQAAMLLEQELEEFDQALALYRQVLERDPNCVAAIRGAGRIYHRLGWWAELVKLHYHELREGGKGPETPVVLCRIGRLLEENLRQTSAAIKAYAKALDQDSSCTPALVGLERLVRADRRWEELVEVLGRYAAARKDHLAAADALCRAAEVADLQLGNLARAAQLFKQALTFDPDSAMALHGLLRVHRRSKRWEEARQVLQQLLVSPAGASEERLLKLEVARLTEFRLGRGPDVELYQAAAGSAPLEGHLRAELTRVLRTTGSPELRTWLLEMGRHTTDPALAAAYLLECVQVDAFSAEGGARPGLEAARESYQRKPDDLTVVWSLERELWNHGCWEELAGLREKEAQLELEPAVRVVKLSSAALAYLHGGKDAEAGRVARECLNFDAHCLPALKVLCHLAEKEKNWSELAALYDRLAEASSDPRNRLESCLEAAELWVERVGDTSRALASLAVALSRDPGQPAAFARAETLLRQRGEFEELSRLYRRRIAVCDDQGEKVDLMRSHARLLRDDLGSAARAIGEFSGVLSIAPQDIESLVELSELLEVQGHWSDAVARLGALADVADQPELRRTARLRQARLWLTHLHEPVRAQKTLTAILEQHPTDLEARQLLVELCRAEGNWGEARRILEELLDTGEVKIELWSLLQLAQVAISGLRDEGLRDSYEARAIRVAAAGHEAGGLARLAEHFRGLGEQARLVAAAERVLEAEPTIPGAGALVETAARMMIEDLQQPGRALGLLERQRGADLTALPIARIHALGLERQGKLGEAEQRYREILAQDVTDVAALQGLTRTAARAGQHETVAAAAGLLDLLGAAEAEETALLKGMDVAVTPAGHLDLSGYPLPPELRMVGEALALAAPYLESLYPGPQGDVLFDDHPAAASCMRLARCLDLDAVSVALGGSPGAVAGLGEPVPLVLARELADNPGTPAFRFWVGRALCRALTRAAILDRVDDDGLVELLDGVCGSRSMTEEGAQLRRQLGRLLPRKVRRQLESIEIAVARPLAAQYRSAEERRADRVGLVFCRFPREGLAQLARVEGLATDNSPRIRGLMRFTLSADYARSVGSLWA